MNVDPPTSSDKNSRQVPASAASIVDEVPEEDIVDYGIIATEEHKQHTDSTTFFSVQKI